MFPVGQFWSGPTGRACGAMDIGVVATTGMDGVLMKSLSRGAVSAPGPQPAHSDVPGQAPGRFGSGAAPLPGGHLLVPGRVILRRRPPDVLGAVRQIRVPALSPRRSRGR
ncbi:hypothetical protein GCM10011578_054870 [Streptomyces fuscichromogenes]|uniref:Uncharacterized protein n=1 Tax=Streptomyces fuscichromogenes TaxID=1324013 RepID=A0A918CTJ6_9ACTN|nr:hypothetical protein GCM10011578_054870 [Streptomyces fuscichromogenes]